MLYFCLQYIRNCEVTAPLELRNEIRNLLQNALIEVYK